MAVARGEESAEAAATAAVTTGGVAEAAAASEAAGTAAEAAASRTGSTAERGGATEEEDEDGQTNKPKEAQVNNNVESEVDDALLIQDPKSESVTQSLPSHQVSSPSSPPTNLHPVSTHFPFQ